MARRPEIGNVSLYPDRPLRADEKNGYVLKFYCPIRETRVRRNTGTRDRREARRIQKECADRLVNGQYLESGGAITVELERGSVRSRVQSVLSPEPDGKSWEQCFDAYVSHRKQRGRAKSLTHSISRIQIAGRILDADRAEQGVPPNTLIREYASLAAMERLQERLLAGDEGRYDQRAAMSVNTMMAALMAFFRYCQKHGWIEDVPPLEKLAVDEPMKGRPVSAAEFDQMLEATPVVVGAHHTASWRFVLRVLWETAFRVADVMNFSWDDSRRIHPIWPDRSGAYPTLKIPSAQKNKKAQEIPMLPGLQAVLESVPPDQRRGWVVNPLAVDARTRRRADWFRPQTNDLKQLVNDYSNSAIARVCGVSEAAVRKWFKELGLPKSNVNRPQLGDVPEDVALEMRTRAEAVLAQPMPEVGKRLSSEYVGRVISKIGEKADVIVQLEDEQTGRRRKYASAHDFRRGCAHHLINAGVSAETLKVVLRHEDFKTTEKFYGAVRVAQSAAAELHEKMGEVRRKKDQLVGGLMGGQELPPQLSSDEVEKLKALLRRL